MLAPILLAGAALGFLFLRRSSSSEGSALQAEVLNAANPEFSGYTPAQQIMVALSAYNAGFFRTAIDLAEMAADRIDEQPMVGIGPEDVEEVTLTHGVNPSAVLESAMRGLDPQGRELSSSDAIILRFNVAAFLESVEVPSRRGGFGNPFAVQLLAQAATDIAIQMDTLDAPGAFDMADHHTGPGNIIWPGAAPVEEAA